jgi:UDP-glucose:(heptosyl)LPS alpha-1,3-glucosyltransferase
MKIAFVVHHYHQEAGHSRYVVELARRFATEHEVHVFALEHREDPSVPIHLHRLPGVRATALTRVLSFIPAATRAVRGDFDVVHAQGACIARCDVMTAHICQAAWHASRRETEGRLRLKDHVFAAVVSPIERALFADRRATRVIAVSERLRRDLALHYGREEGVTVVHHGVAVERFSPGNRAELGAPARGELGLRDGAVVFLFVGDLRKGAEAAIRAVARVPGACLVTVSRTHPGRYRALAAALGVADRVFLCAATDRIERWYAAADAFVLPTPYDAFGMVVTEAMASGLPVVASRAAGASELLTHGADGLLLDRPFDVDELAAHVARLTADGALRDRLGRAARTTAERHTWDRVASATMRVYEEVLAVRAAPPRVRA